MNGQMDINYCGIRVRGMKPIYSPMNPYCTQMHSFMVPAKLQAKYFTLMTP